MNLDKLVQTIIGALPAGQLEAVLALSVLVTEGDKLRAELANALQLANEQSARADDASDRLKELRASISQALGVSLTQQPINTPPSSPATLTVLRGGG